MLQQSLMKRNQPETQKQRLFRLFHTLVQHYAIHPNLYYLLLAIEALQMIFYACHSSFPDLWM